MLGRVLLIAALSLGLASINIKQAQTEEIKNGVNLKAPLSAVLPGGINRFDPPCSFAETIAFNNSFYLNPKTEVRIFSRAALLNECAGFSVTGYSPPNFLAWNCQGSLADGTKPSLPATFLFSTLVAGMSIQVASSNPAGTPARLVGMNAAGTVIATHTLSLTSATQPLTVRFGRQIKSAKLFGPCLMIADNLRVIP